MYDLLGGEKKTNKKKCRINGKNGIRKFEDAGDSNPPQGEDFWIRGGGKKTPCRFRIGKGIFFNREKGP